MQPFFLIVLMLVIVLPALVSAAEIPTQMSPSDGAVSTANQTCKVWWETKCQKGEKACASQACSQTSSGKTVSGTCMRDACQAQTYTDPEGKTKSIGGGMGFLQQALGLLQGLQGLFGKGGGGSPAPGSSPAPSSYGDAGMQGIGTSGVAPIGGVQGITPLDWGTGAPPTGPATPDLVRGSFESGETRPARERVDHPEPSATFLEAVAGGFSNIANKVSEITLGVTDTAATQPTTLEKARKAIQEKQEVRTGKEGATIEVSTGEDGTGISGFYGVSGGETTGGNPSLVGRLCISRPWANNFLSNFIAPTFFDGLCNRGGYHVGALPLTEEAVVNTTQAVEQARERAKAENTALVTKKEKGISCTPEIIRQGTPAELEWSCGTGERLIGTVGFKVGVNDSKLVIHPQVNTQYGIACSNNFEDSCTVTVINPRVMLWAEPKSVRLGARTVIYWNTEDVEEGSCRVTGPSFSETGPFGQASTVALHDVTTYTATCVALDKQEVTEKISVDLAL